MKTFLVILSLSLALNLVSGNALPETEDRQMNISETKKCYVYGQCQEYSLDFKATQDAEGCHKFCGKSQECNWWSWEPAFELCMLYSNCTEDGVDPPAVEPCPECISGEKECPARECHGAFKCKGDFVDSFAIATLEECIQKCNDVEDCQWFTLEKANDHCILYEECNDQFDCETCASGEKKCANGYKGTTPAPASNPGNGSAPASNPGVGSNEDLCGFPVSLLKWQFIDIRRCANCAQFMDTVTRTVPKEACEWWQDTDACISEKVLRELQASELEPFCTAFGNATHPVSWDIGGYDIGSCRNEILRVAAECPAPAG